MIIANTITNIIAFFLALNFFTVFETVFAFLIVTVFELVNLLDVEYCTWYPVTDFLFHFTLNPLDFAVNLLIVVVTELPAGIVRDFAFTT